MMKPLWRSIVAVCVLAGAGMVAGSEPASAASPVVPDHSTAQYRVVDLGPGMSVVDINESGMAIGYREIEGTPSTFRPFVWYRGRLTYLSGLGGAWANVVDINNRGHIAGTGATRSGATHGFLVRNGRTVDLGTLGGRETSAAALNDRDEVVGSSQLRSGTSQAFLWRNGRMTNLGALGGRGSGAVGINDAGQVAGNSPTRTGRQHGFLWQRGRMTDIGHLGGDYTYVTQINRRGHVFGLSRTTNHADEWFLWRDGRMTDTGIDEDYGAQLNDRDLVAGTSLGPNGGGAMTWFAGVTRYLPALPGDEGGFAVRANDLGRVVGYASWGLGPLGTPMVRAETWYRGTVRPLPDMGMPYTWAYGINNHNVIFGEGLTPGSQRHGLLWFPLHRNR